ncbi:MAG: carbamoyl phosphate synthase small subunit, partial [Lachnospiraceae bacterium]|nr:carbamoyl phosphate synthase small subunit [Lachnospiraceae bacterium]
MKAFLILEDGTVFEGIHIGADKSVISEIVFNTSMAGYLEVLTDPSYAGQAVCMTYPLIGNYGVCRDDMESLKPWPDGFIVRELSRVPSNFRSDLSIQQFLSENGVPGIAGIDTRALTRILREKGTMNGMITTDADYHIDEIIPKLKAYTTGKVVERVSCQEKYSLSPSRTLAENGPLSGFATFDSEAYAAGKREQRPSMIKELNGTGLKVALLDFGAKGNIARSLAQRGCEVTVYPALTKAEEIIQAAPDGIMLSHGPGDPKECTDKI